MKGLEVNLIFRKKTMVCFGTSLTQTGGWVEMLQKQLPDWKVINSGQGGMNSNWGRDNFEKKVLRFNPNIVLMEFAINDCYIGPPFYKKPTFEESSKNINFMVDKLWGARVFYLTMNPPLDKFLFGRNPAEQRPEWEKYTQEHCGEAKFRNATIIDIADYWKMLPEKAFLKFCPDGLHPNELGSGIITAPTILDQVIKW